MFLCDLLGCTNLLWVAVIAAVLALRRYLKGASWTGLHRAEGQTIIVTGANSGIGRALTEELLKRGARVIMGCRNRARTESVRQEMIKLGALPERIQIEEMDLSSFASIVAFTDRVASTYDTIDVLVNNAGMLRAGGKTRDGNDAILQDNFLGHFLLTELLLKKITLNRIVAVASCAQWWCPTLDLHEKGYASILQYGRAKCAEIAHIQELGATGVAAFSCHPGVVATNIMEGTWLDRVTSIFTPLMPFYMKTPLEGAQSALMLALAPLEELQMGGYYNDCAPATIQWWINTVEARKKLLAQTKSIVKDYL